MKWCACGCGASLADLRSDARYLSDTHRKRARRRRTPAKARTRPGGLQVSYRKAIQAIRLALIDYGPDIPWSECPDALARRVAEVYASDALSPAQRARLESREARIVH